MFIAYSLIKFQDHGHRKKTQAILALSSYLLFLVAKTFSKLLDLQLLINHQRKTH